MLDGNPWTIAGVAAAIMLGGFCKGAFGISLALIAVSLAAIFVDIPTAVALMTVPVLIANIWQVGSNEFKGAAWKDYWPLYVAILPGVAVGAKVLTTVDPLLISGVVGVLVVVFAMLIYSQPDWRLAPEPARRIAVPVGLVGGLVAGISGFLPPVLMYMVALKLPKERFVGAIGIAYLTAVVALMVFLAGYEFLSWELVLWSALAALPMFGGQLIGHYTRRHIAEAPFRLMVLILMLVSGANLIRKALA